MYPGWPYPGEEKTSSRLDVAVRDTHDQPMTALQLNSAPLVIHQEYGHKPSSTALQYNVTALTTRLETLNRRRQAEEYRKVADERNWLIAQLLPHVRELGTALSLLAAMRGHALAYGRAVVRAMLLTDPSRYEEPVRGLLVPDLLLLVSVLESAGGTGPEVSEFVQRVQQMAAAAHQALVG